jgi:hypothetical protein
MHSAKHPRRLSASTACLASCCQQEHCRHVLTPCNALMPCHCAGCRRQLRLLANNKQAEAETKKTAEDGSAAARQMLGMKGAADETDIWKIRVQLTKPVTWVPLIWGEPHAPAHTHAPQSWLTQLYVSVFQLSCGSCYSRHSHIKTGNADHIPRQSR